MSSMYGFEYPTPSRHENNKAWMQDLWVRLEEDENDKSTWTEESRGHCRAVTGLN